MAVPLGAGDRRLAPRVATWDRRMPIPLVNCGPDRHTLAALVGSSEVTEDAASGALQVAVACAGREAAGGEGKASCSGQ